MGNCSNICSINNKQFKYDTDNFNKILTEDLKELPQEYSLNITTQANTNKSLIDKSQQQGQSMDAGLFSKFLNDKLESRNCSFIQQQSAKDLNSEIVNSLNFSLEIQELLSLYLVNNKLVHQSQLQCSSEVMNNYQNNQEINFIQEQSWKEYSNYKQIQMQCDITNQENTNFQSQQNAQQFQMDLTKLIQFQNQARQNCEEIIQNPQLENSIDRDCQIQILKVKPSMKNDSMIQQMKPEIEKKSISIQNRITSTKILSKNESKSRLNKKNENALTKNTNKINLPEHKIEANQKGKSPNLHKKKFEKMKSFQTFNKQANKENKLSCNQTPIKQSNQKIKQRKSILKKSSIKSFQNTPNMYDIPPEVTDHEIVNFVADEGEEEQQPLKVFMTLEQLLVDNSKQPEKLQQTKTEFQQIQPNQQNDYSPIQVKIDLQQLFQQPQAQQASLFQSNNNSLEKNNVTFFSQMHLFKK